MPTTPPTVAILAYDRLCTFEFGCAMELFSLERPELEVPWYETIVVGVSPQPLTVRCGLSLQTTHTLNDLDGVDLIVVPGWSGPHIAVPPELAECLRRHYARGARLASFCSGVFVLAATGLLDGRRATAHWMHIDILTARHPAIEIETNVLYVDAGRLLTSAGSAAAIDLGLHIIRKDYGAKIANRVAQRMVVAAHREGGQAQFLPRPVIHPGNGEIAPVLDRLRSRLDATWSVGAIAQMARLSNRTLLRRFQDTIGLSPLAWLNRERVALAQELLETTRLGMAQIAERTGLGTPETFRHHFKKCVGISPQQYRRSFQAAEADD